VFSGLKGGVFRDGSASNALSSLSDSSNRYLHLNDLEGDGDVDAVLVRTSGVALFLNEGNVTDPNFVQAVGTTNPFGSVDLEGKEPTSAFLVDLDGDGDLDFVIAFFEEVRILWNENLTFTESPGTRIASSAGSKCFSPADVDRNGDIDIFMGTTMGALWLLENTGSNSFVANGGTSNPCFFENVGLEACFSFVDIDLDGDQDAFVSTASEVFFFRNEGTETDPIFTESASPIEFLSVIGPLAFGDIDGDGDEDAYGIDSSGSILEFKNDDRDPVPAFTKFDEDMNPLGRIIPELGWGFSVVSAVDINDDGLLDVFVGLYNGETRFFRNDGSIANPLFTPVDTSDDPFYYEIDFTFFHAAPAFLDFDGDGDLDSFIGTTTQLMMFENTGNASVPEFTAVTPNASRFPFSQGAGSILQLAFSDLDGDGDLDLALGREAGDILFYENQPDSSGASFVQLSGGSNPFDGINVGQRSNIHFADVDGDGDLDAVVGNVNGDALFLRNDGTVQAPNFVQVQGGENPFESVDVGTFSNFAFGDFDNDGDFDLIAGSRTGRVTYFRNTARNCASSCTGGRGTCAQPETSTSVSGFTELQLTAISQGIQPPSLAAGMCLCQESFQGSACEQCSPTRFGPRCQFTCPDFHRHVCFPEKRPFLIGLTWTTAFAVKSLDSFE